MSPLHSKRRTASRVVLLALVAPLASAGAQIGGNGSHGAFRPTADVTLDTTPNGGVFQFTSIAIPIGVTVRLHGANPARLLSQGDVLVEGTLDAGGAGRSLAQSPGGFAGGNLGSSAPGGEPGHGPGGGQGGPYLPWCTRGSNATHRQTYGAAYPFDLRGGSGGGGACAGPSCFNLNVFAGGAGGGTVVILADGSITLSGQILAEGESGSQAACASQVCYAGGSGSGGSIMLRALSGVAVTGRVSAIGGEALPLGRAESGFVRIDAYGQPPSLNGSGLPSPTALELPAMRTETPPRIGGTWDLSIASVPGDVVLIVLAG